MFKNTSGLLSTIALMLSALSSRAFIASPSTARAASPRVPETSRRMIGSILDLLNGGPGKGELISPDKALPGRETKMPNIEGLRHYVLGNKIDEVPEGHQEAVFANGVSKVQGYDVICPTFILCSHHYFLFSASGVRKRAFGDFPREFIQQLLDIAPVLPKIQPTKKLAVG